jgi:UDP-glucose 4-epimerase
MKTVLVTGSQGFIGSYVCEELLSHDYMVVGVDNFSKYGDVIRPHESHKNFTFIKRDVSAHISDLYDIKPDYILGLAAMIGGISYFHKYAYDLLATNERILASTFDYAINRMRHGLKRIIVVSSSMVFEETDVYPTPESQVKVCPPPKSTYGFQKLASEYFCKGAYEQYGLPYTIIRPFNCVGIGENEAVGSEEVSHGNSKLLMSHVVPDLIYKALVAGPDGPLPILGTGEQVRHYTYGGDIARGIRVAMESEKAINEDFNISSSVPHTVDQIASIIWKLLYGDAPLVFDYCEPYKYDVQKRSPDVSKAKEVLGFECNTDLESVLVGVIDWVKKQYPEINKG